MNDRSFLTFTSNDLRYGISTTLVREIFPLPELTPIAEAPGDTLGVLNLRGQIVPVMHLNRRVSALGNRGRLVEHCQLSDNVIAIEWEGLLVGAIVHQVNEVLTLSDRDMSPEPDYGRLGRVNTAFLQGIATVGDELIALLNPEALIRMPDEVAAMAWEQQATLEWVSDSDGNVGISPETGESDAADGVSGSLADFYTLYCPQATAGERKLFRQRADALRQPLEGSETADDVLPFAVIGLAGEQFALNLTAVKEFINVRNLTAIPCCPPQIVGNTNLRGEVLTLIDIRRALNLTATSVEVSAEAVVVQVDDIVAGIAVDRVFDVAYVPKTATRPLDTVATQQDAFLSGTTDYGDRLVGILDLPRLLTQGGLVVNDAM
ncbi:MAG: chemotaxis protein CheW [Cyanobacteria bacterium J06642_2]